MDILRFITAGSVDDGKSTLIGRLLYDTNNIKYDVLQNMERDLNLAHITDGLRAEREQGITIDVAYKYFTTAKRKYIVTDAPGHFQYTKNLVTGASNADMVIILVDAVNGITEQTVRHSMVASFLKIGQVVVAINKMDLVGYDERMYHSIKSRYNTIAERLKLSDVTFIPMSALLGDNVSFPSANMPWYDGGTLLQYLEQCPPTTASEGPFRMAVQYTSQGIAGKVLSGTVKKDDTIAVTPGSHRAKVEKIFCGFNEVPEAIAGGYVILQLQGDHQPKRGDVLADPAYVPGCCKTLNATICWLDAGKALVTGTEYLLRTYTAEHPCKVTRILTKTNLATGLVTLNDDTLVVNEFATVTIETAEAIVLDTSVSALSRGILIDPVTNYTSAALML